MDLTIRARSFIMYSDSTKGGQSHDRIHTHKTEYTKNA